MNKNDILRSPSVKWRKYRVLDIIMVDEAKKNVLKMFYEIKPK